MKNYTFAILATLLIGLARADAAPRPNVVFILADDLGYGELGCYGQKKIRTPNIDRLASQGLRFTRHYSGAPVCAPARCVLLTGKHLGHAQIRGVAGGLLVHASRPSGDQLTEPLPGLLGTV